MRATERFGARRGAAAAVLAGAALAAAGCGGSDFENTPRPPAPAQVTGVITESRVVVSPAEIGAGPVVIVVSNQSRQPRTLTLDGPGRRITTAPIAPSATGEIRSAVEPGEYEVRAGSEKAQVREIRPATLSIGRERRSSSDTLLLP
ncbi:MAG: hypothetical protein IRZ21_11705 [Thermoleophilaceae bacterium]|nr:hypothetical protein [Thermoleophilaceae bacterium]